jgi:hypothetical protein
MESQVSLHVKTDSRVDQLKKNSLPPMGEAVEFYLILQYFNFVNLVRIRVYDMNAAGNAGIK